MTGVEVFEGQRSRMFGLAYRMLGSAAEAEDVVQDAFLRWHRADLDAIDTPAAWLTKVVTNLCLSRLSSARMRRESYVGPWLPEPVRTGDGALGPLETVEQRELVSLGVLVVLERLTAAERAVFVLREAFGYQHREIAGVLDVDEVRSRQLYARARRHVAEARRRFPADRERHAEIVRRFFAAAVEGDVAGLTELLAEDVVSWSDGGGKATAARRPIVGRDKVLRYLGGFRQRPEFAQVDSEFAEVNGQLAVLLRWGGALAAVFVPEVDGDRVTALRSIINPDKLHAVANLRSP
ncbi:RNA polymerase sigma-70 factor [Kibdelosporangium phytohabitans]|uniref:RNA polymerase subunit sigma-24 n=1 Tax=Kibdelosporangium phytohabitans TaxID=860235 RepID=A0A0N9I468_9PSEU|nr:RNA polymerase sigma-70 factor [Kibdelosporangium phytohabitans]ALG14782.1 RNA polymerase subunit sigma-24 [Kibdelosporangium phytohabitans]MBE1471153.1 RNA polymerase sigma-70 factor (ECF subfamily) [Kibdelosporangium phytohabitans]